LEEVSRDRAGDRTYEIKPIWFIEKYARQRKTVKTML
jgi:hypothetical protein